MCILCQQAGQFGMCMNSFAAPDMADGASAKPWGTSMAELSARFTPPPALTPLQLDDKKRAERCPELRKSRLPCTILTGHIDSLHSNKGCTTYYIGCISHQMVSEVRFNQSLQVSLVLVRPPC